MQRLRYSPVASSCIVSRSFRYDFSKFLAEYEACHMDYVRMRFTEVSTVWSVETVS